MRYCIRAAGLAALLSLSGTLAFSGTHDTEFRLEALDMQGRTVLTIPMQDGNDWCLLWNHSVAGFTVQDCFATVQGTMVLKSSHQPDFAAGLGYMDGRGRLDSDGQGGYVIAGINEPVPGNRLVLRVGGMAVNHRVLYRGKETSLSQIAAGQRITLRVSHS